MDQEWLNKYRSDSSHDVGEPVCLFQIRQAFLIVFVVFPDIFFPKSCVSCNFRLWRLSGNQIE